MPRHATVMMSWCRARNLLLSAGWLLSCGCESAPPQPQPYGPRAVLEVGRWEIRSGDETLGHLVKLRIDDPVDPLEFFRVENDHGQWVGHISHNGRFSRRVPFREDEEDLGIYPMQEGLALLLEVEGAVQLEGDGAAEAASWRRGDR